MIQGGCACGKLRYELGEEPREPGDCHCVDCRRWSGAPFVTWGSVARENFRVMRGELGTAHIAGRIRRFAACCGSPIAFEDNASPDIVEVTIATLDHPERFAPDHVTWLEDRLPWVVLDDRLPHHLRGRSS